LPSATQSSTMADTTFGLDPAYLLNADGSAAINNSGMYDMTAYDCMIPTEDDALYYSSASPIDTSSPSSSNDGSGYTSSGNSPPLASSTLAHGDASPVMMSPVEYAPNGMPQAAVPNAGYHQMNIYNQPAQGYTYSYPALYTHAAYAGQHMQPAMQPMVQVPLPPMQHFQQVYVPYGYGPCVEPSSLVGSTGAPMPAPPTDAVPPPPTRRDRRSARQRDPNYVPRPANPFICFRQEWLKRLQRGEVDYKGPRDQRTMSFRISSDWNGMTEAEKTKFRREALQRKRQHAAKYPGYKFAPKQKDRDMSLSGSEDN